MKHRKSKSPVTQCKDRIQSVLREIAIKTYGKCVLSKYRETGVCGPRRKDGQIIVQAEHLVSRARSVSYADMRNIVLLCKRHHGYWKTQNSRRYWEIIEEIIGPERWKWIKKVEADQRGYNFQLYDWEKLEIGLRDELKKLNL